MTDLKRLRVSLTKHGAHKMAALLMRYPADEILRHLEGSVPGINIERAQAKKNLSVGPGNSVPQIWVQAKSLGKDAVNALTLLAIIFSHEKLITAMAQGSSGSHRGKITRGNELKGKDFTNFSHIFQQLGYGKETDQNSVEYDLTRLFRIKGLSVLAKKLFELKLEPISNSFE